jgi:hypothetical protein
MTSAPATTPRGDHVLPSPAAQFSIVPGAGHLLPLTNWRAILEAAIA